MQGPRSSWGVADYSAHIARCQAGSGVASGVLAFLMPTATNYDMFFPLENEGYGKNQTKHKTRLPTITSLAQHAQYFVRVVSLIAEGVSLRQPEPSQPMLLKTKARQKQQNMSNSSPSSNIRPSAWLRPSHSQKACS